MLFSLIISFKHHISLRIFELKDIQFVVKLTHEDNHRESTIISLFQTAT